MTTKPLCFTFAAALALLVGTMAATSLGTDPGLIHVLSGNAEPLQPIRDRRPLEPISPGDVTAGLVGRGYRDVSTPLRKGAHYVVQATGRRGELLTIVVDVLTGEISGLRRRRA